jgi:hypothetical protein
MTDALRLKRAALVGMTDALCLKTAALVVGCDVENAKSVSRKV